MSVVVIDTNILLTDFHLEKAHFGFLFEGCARCGIQVFVPEIVFDEVAGNYSKQLKRNAEALELNARKLKILGVEADFKSINQADAVEKYKSGLVKRLVEKKVQIEPYPSISAKDLVKASYSGKKPYKETGDGFKDHLIFESLLSIAEETKDDVWFLTNNHKDFCGQDKKLHSDLCEKLPSGISVRVFESLHLFNNTILTPQLESLDEVAKQIQNGDFEGFDLEDKTWEILHEEICEKPYVLGGLNIPLDEAAGQYIDYHKADEITVNRLSEDELLIEVAGEMSLEVFGFIDKNDLWHIHDGEIENVHISDHNWNEWVAAATSVVNMTFRITLIFDEAKHKVESVSVEVDPSDFTEDGET